MAVVSGKVFAESSLTKDAWANTRIENGQKVSAYGRVPGVDTSWRKPVDTLNRNVEEITSLKPNYNSQKLQELFARYLPKWEQLAGNMELFKNGINGKDIDSFSSGGMNIWENDNLKLELMASPHLKGLHLMVTPKESFQRQWQTVKGRDSEQVYLERTLEATAVAMGVQNLLDKDKKGEIHNSGNWAGDLKTTEEGGKIDMKNLTENRKAEKRSHRPDIATPENQINTGMHVHVYIPEEGPVILPEMSEQEAIQKGRNDIVEQWKKIPPATIGQAGEIRAKLGGGKLTKWLEENCQGKLNE